MKKGNILYVSAFNSMFSSFLNKGSVMGYIVCPQIRMLKPYPPVPQTMTVFRDKVSKERTMINDKMYGR